MVDGDHEHGVAEPESIDSGRERHATYGKPQSRVGSVIRNAGYATYRELAAAVPCVHELISGVRNGKRPISAGLRRRLSEVLCIAEEEVMSALTEDPDPSRTTPHQDAHRVALLSSLGARIEVLNDEEADDENELRLPPGMMVPHETWDEVARAVGCSVRTIARIRSGADVPSAGMIERLSRALLTPPENALFALRRPYSAWRW